MSDLYRRVNISKYDRNDPRTLRVNESEITRAISADKSTIIYFRGKSINSLKLLYARVMQILEEKSSKDSSADVSHLKPGEREFYYLLSALSGLLLTLSIKDKSSDTKFLKDLSSTWNFLQLSVARRQGQKYPHEYMDLLNETIYSIENYGTGNGEPLGYYIKGRKDGDWFPVPYIQMLSALHLDSINDKEGSILFLWQRNLKELLIAIVSSS